MLPASDFKSVVKTFPPGYFALVMATGIVSSACLQLHYDTIGKSLFVLNNVQYVALLIIFAARLVLFFSQVKSDLSTHEKGAGFLTFVAASAILGSGYVQGHHAYTAGKILLIVAIIAWII
ncbi:MAG: C4-dicarboxylate ABC transporter, partial [Bacteroidota bacterium]|nr:C4-dicarboxylate ABC transporter [Bacteroidota bacterium]